MDVRSIEDVEPVIEHNGTVPVWWLVSPREMFDITKGGHLELVSEFEVAGGGRYDGLPASFGEDIPAVGFSFSLDRLEQIVTPTLNISDTDATNIDIEQGFEKALQLRQAGKAVKLCL